MSQASPVQTAMRNCAGGEGPFGFGDRVAIRRHHELLRLKAVEVSIA